MEKEQIDEATWQLFKFIEDANHAVVESVGTTKESNTKFAQRVYQDWMKEWLEVLESHVENTRALMRELERHTQDQQEALQKMAQGSKGIHFDFSRASVLSHPQTILLHESLQFCLLALESRCPRHILNINEEVLGPQSLGAEGWTAQDLIELFQNTYPLLLVERARLEVDCRCKGIYLLGSSEQIPAFWVYLGVIGEKMPEYRGNMAARRKNQLTTSQA